MSSDTISKKTFTRIALLQTVVLVTVLVLLGLRVHFEAREIHLKSLQAQVVDLVEVLAGNFPNPMPKDWCRKTGGHTKFRLSVISSSDGHIVCDNIYPTGIYPNVLDRPEIQSAIHSPDHRGKSIRMSKLAHNLQRLYATYYFKERGLVLRGGFTIEALEDALAAFDRMFLIATFVLSLILAGILQWTSRKILFTRAKELIELSRRKMQEEFVANVSHEFRTPLTSIHGFAGAALEDLNAGRPADREFVRIILKDSNRLLTMVNDLLDLSAIDSGAITLTKEEIGTREITEDVLKSLTMAYPDRKHSVHMSFDIDTIFADPDRLTQILMNLIGNAFKYCPPHSEIAVRWMDSDENPDEVQILIEDNGPGIPLEIQEKLFQRFVRTQEGPAKTKGAGLGLSIVKGLVERHGGSIQLLHPDQPGTTFLLTFRKS